MFRRLTETERKALVAKALVGKRQHTPWPAQRPEDGIQVPVHVWQRWCDHWGCVTKVEPYHDIADLAIKR